MDITDIEPDIQAIALDDQGHQVGIDAHFLSFQFQIHDIATGELVLILQVW